MRYERNEMKQEEEEKRPNQIHHKSKGKLLARSQSLHHSPPSPPHPHPAPFSKIGSNENQSGFKCVQQLSRLGGPHFIILPALLPSPSCIFQYMYIILFKQSGKFVGKTFSLKCVYNV